MIYKKKIENDNGIFIFRGHLRLSSREGCSFCDFPLDTQYSNIIEKLKLEKLLEESYKGECCWCYSIKIGNKGMFLNPGITPSDVLDLHGYGWRFKYILNIYKNHKELYNKLLGFLGQFKEEFEKKFSSFIQEHLNT